MEKINQLERTKAFALNIIKLVEILSETKIGRIIGSQLFRSGTSVDANYRAACCSKSARDFINKLKIVEEEIDETIYWLELIEESGLKGRDENKMVLTHGQNPGTGFRPRGVGNLPGEIKSLKKEAYELIAIFVAAITTTKRRLNDNQTKT